MPRGDGTGPQGFGSMTGRGAGFCAGYAMPGYANPAVRGFGGGFGGGFGYGRGRGFGRGFGRGPVGYGVGGYAPAVNPYAYGPAPVAPQVTPQQELDGLKGQAEYLKDALDGIKKRIDELQIQNK